MLLYLGPLTPLPHPIPSGDWKRITFLYTTGEYLIQAEIVNDLVVHSEDRNLLWRALRERALQGGAYRVDEIPEIPLSPEILAMFGMFEKGEN